MRSAAKVPVWSTAELIEALQKQIIIRVVEHGENEETRVYAKIVYLFDLKGQERLRSPEEGDTCLFRFEYEGSLGDEKMDYAYKGIYRQQLSEFMYGSWLKKDEWLFGKKGANLAFRIIGDNPYLTGLSGDDLLFHYGKISVLLRDQIRQTAGCFNEGIRRSAIENICRLWSEFVRQRLADRFPSRIV